MTGNEFVAWILLAEATGILIGASYTIAVIKYRLKK